MKSVNTSALLASLFISVTMGSAAFAGGGGTGPTQPGENTDSSEPARTPANLLCGDTSAGANGLKNNGRFDLFTISFEKTGAVFIGSNDWINGNSGSSWSIDNRRAITESFSDNGQLMQGQFRALPPDDENASDDAKRVDLIQVKFDRGSGVASIQIDTKNMVTGVSTQTTQQLRCSLQQEI